ncbi:MAG: leucyl aminopeptidase family protein [Candidatus Rhabdochlamydia sp.]
MKKVLFIDSLDKIEVDTLILCHKQLQEEIDQKLKRSISYNLQRFSLPLWITTNGEYPIPRLVFVDEKDDLSSFAIDSRVAIASDNIPSEKLAFELLKKNPLAETLVFLCAHPKQAEARFQKYQHLLQSIFFAKEMIAAPANLMTPMRVANRCRLLERQGVIVEVLDEEQLKRINADALLAVGKGSPNTPKMVIMEYRGSKDSPIALVGKGICYDSGGINLKNSHLVEMKWDKAGSGAVIGVMDVLSRLNAAVHVVGVIVLAENMPDGNALKPGDVISSLGGKSIEIIDTDCEGRLALADGIAYVQKYFLPKVLIDLGTLTLETFGALGSEYAGLFCNDAILAKKLIQAGNATGEKLWRLPLGEYYANQMHSKIADLKNSGVLRYGASSAAAEFLRAFVDPQIHWAHIDISGTAWKVDAPEEGVTAFGVQLIAEYILNQVSDSLFLNRDSFFENFFSAKDGNII